ncbi:hypothetical protein HYV49_02460 [Candidatus Pacearchaeota archaeon]|nr:hypothetical protein [Candidatus Pacearchaeota archaeon]
MERKNYDTRCPHYQEILQDEPPRYDKGEHICTIEEVIMFELIRYDICRYDNHQLCPRFLEHHGIVRTLEEEREEIVSSIPQSD